MLAGTLRKDCCDSRAFRWLYTDGVPLNGAMFRSQSSPDSEGPGSAIGSSSESLETLMMSESRARLLGAHGDDKGGSGRCLAIEREVGGVGNVDEDGGSAGDEDRQTLNGDGERDESESGSNSENSARLWNVGADKLVLEPSAADDGVG